MGRTRQDRVNGIVFQCDGFLVTKPDKPDPLVSASPGIQLIYPERASACMPFLALCNEVDLLASARPSRYL